MSRSSVGQRLVIAGAKGGVGKTVLSIAIALQALEEGKKVIIADTDFRLPTVCVCFDLYPEQSMGQVLSGERQIEEVLTHTEGGLQIVPGDFDLPGLEGQSPAALSELTAQLARLSALADLVVYDTASSSGQELEVVLPVADRVLVVMTAEPSGMAGGFATLRTISRHPELAGRVGLLINQAANRGQALEYGEHLVDIARRTLRMEVPIAGHILADPHVREAVRTKRQFITLFPYAPASMAVRSLVSRLGRNGLAPEESGRGGFISWLLGGQ